MAVTTYGTLPRLQLPSGVDLAMLVADEAHFVKNPEAQRSQAVERWAMCADRVLFLTGTPVENRLQEFRNLAAYLNPQIARSIDVTDAIAGADGFRRAVAPVYLRRNQEDVLNELPERLEVLDWLEPSEHDERCYRDAVQRRHFADMRRAAFSCADRTRSAKLGRLMEVVEESADNGWKVVVFSYFRHVLGVVEEALGPLAHGTITGSVPPVQRQGLVDRFSERVGPGVLVSQIEAGGVGMNLQAASVVILTEPQWKPTTEEQAIARCHRMGQTRRVRVHRLLTADSVDEHMRNILSGKADLIERYIKESALKDASPDAVDISEGRFRDAIIDKEMERLGL